MTISNTEKEAYEAAKKRVAKERDFYTHLVIYVVINITIYFFRERLLVFIGIEDKGPEFFKWWGFGTIITPVAWGIGLFFHWVWAFEKIPFFSSTWEEKKIKKLMQEEDYKE